MGLQKRVCLSLIGITILIGSCIKLSQPSSKIEHFTLEYDAPQLSDHTPLAHVIRVERFSVAPEYNSDRITYRDKSFKRDAYVYYRWRANPGDLITSFLVRDMKHSGLFKAVLSYDSRLPSSFLVEGTVDEFFEFDTEERWEAVLSVGITLMAEHEPESSRKILFQKSFHARHPCARKHPRALAEAMSEAMSAVSKDILETLHSFLKKHTK
jgi:cholesterol transport system auxiliary component